MVLGRAIQITRRIDFCPCGADRFFFPMKMQMAGRRVKGGRCGIFCSIVKESEYGKWFCDSSSSFWSTHLPKTFTGSCCGRWFWWNQYRNTSLFTCSAAQVFWLQRIQSLSFKLTALPKVMLHHSVILFFFTFPISQQQPTTTSQPTSRVERTSITSDSKVAWHLTTWRELTRPKGNYADEN